MAFGLYGGAVTCSGVDIESTLLGIRSGVCDIGNTLGE